MRVSELVPPKFGEFSLLRRESKGINSETLKIGEQMGSKFRISSYPTSDFELLGYDFDLDKPITLLNDPVHRLINFVEFETRRMPLIPAEWNFLAVVLKNWPSLYATVDNPLAAWKEIFDLIADTPPHVAGIRQVDIDALCQKLYQMSPGQQEALLSAIRWAWRNAKHWANTDPWWSFNFRRAVERYKDKHPGVDVEGYTHSAYNSETVE